MKPSFFQKAVINFNRSDTGDIINVNQNNIPMYATTDGTKIKDSGISKESLATVISQSTETVNHISNNQIHVTQSDKNSWDSAVSDINSHINSDTSNIIHITQADRNNWNSKLSNEDIQVIVNNYDTALENHARNKNINVYHITLEQLNKLINTYTKNEVDNIVSSVVTGIDWKEAVQSYEDLANPSSELLIERPELANPEEGWTINTIEHGITYRYRAAKIHEIDTFAQLINIVPEDKDLDLYMVHESGDEIYKYDDDPENGYDIATGYWRVTSKRGVWIAISINFLTLATEDANGLMSADDKYKLNGIEENANNYVHPTDANSQHVSTTQIANWTELLSQAISGASLTERDPEGNVTYKYKGLINQGILDKINNIEANANNYVHPIYYGEGDKEYSHLASDIKEDENHLFIDREFYNYIEKLSVFDDSLCVSENHNGYMSTSDFVSFKQMRNKLGLIDDEANYYVHPSSHPASMISTTNELNFVSLNEKDTWNNKADKTLATKNNNGLMSKEDKNLLDTLGSQDIANKVDKSSIVAGQSQFNTTDGTAIVHNLGTLNYAVSVTPIGTNARNIGTVYVEQLENSCVVRCSGTAAGPDYKFSYILIKY